MRALAASSIVILHVWVYSSPNGQRVNLGWLTSFMPDLRFGVTLFFTLSGFLLYRPFAAALIRSRDRPSFRAYLRNRALRILPAYWAILFLCALVLRSVFVRDESGDLEVQGAPGLGWLVRSLSLTQNYTPSGVVTGIGPAWSLAVEVVFYLALPALVLTGSAVAKRTITRAGRSRSALVPPLALLVLGLGGKAASALVGSGPDGGWGADWNSVLERSFLCQADLFAFGMALAVFHVEVEDGARRATTRVRVAIAMAAIGAYAFTTTSMTQWDQLGHSPYNTAMALSCTLFLALVVLPPASPRPSPIVRVLETRPLVGTGLVSYSMFLWHLPIIFAMKEQGLTIAGRAGFFINLAAVGFVTLALSVLTYRFVEVPALRRKHPGTRPRREQAVASQPVHSADLTRSTRSSMP